MATFVLVHGAWHGGWCWRPISDLLTADGHTVFRPTLTGLGDRSHLISREVGLSTHVQDVVAMLEMEDLFDVVLVGHSYAGMVITGVADRVPERIAHLIYYDAFLPDSGQCAFDLLPPTIAAHFKESAAQDGQGWLMPRRPLEALGVCDEAAKNWLKPRLVDHPLATYSDRLEFGWQVREVRSSFISCTDWAAVFAPQAVKARDLGWPVREVAADHEALATAPQLLASALTDLL